MVRDAGRSGTHTLVLVFDGACGFCSAAARWARRRLPQRVHVEPWQTLDLAALGLSEEDAAGAVQWVDESGGSSAGAPAVAEALRRMGGGYRALGSLLRAPFLSEVAAWVYAVVARNRHRLPGSAPVCPPHRLEASSRRGERRATSE